MDAAGVGTVSLVLYLITVTVFSIRVSVLEKRIQNLADQQEEWWQRHMKNHPKGKL